MIEILARAVVVQLVANERRDKTVKPFSWASLN